MNGIIILLYYKYFDLATSFSLDCFGLQLYEMPSNVVLIPVYFKSPIIDVCDWHFHTAYK
jgi:hypothetical protein